MRLFSFLHREPLDLVASEIRDLEQRCEKAADARDPFRHLVASNAWCAPADVDYGLLDLPTVSIKRGGYVR